MFGLDSVWHWVVLLVVVILVFGTGKLRHAGRDLGTAIAGFRKGMQGDDRTSPAVVPDERERP